MGVSTTSIIRKNVSIQEIQEFISVSYGSCELLTTSIDDYFVCVFSDNQDKRQLNIHTDVDNILCEQGIQGVLLSLGYWGNAVQIMENIANHFGGYVQNNDCIDDFFRPINETKFLQEGDLSKENYFKMMFFRKMNRRNISFNEMSDLLDQHKEIVLNNKE